MKNTKLIHKELLPFSRKTLEKYFVGNKKHQAGYFLHSIDKYKIFENDKSMKKSDYKFHRQAEKDERFYTARTFISIFEKSDAEKKKDLENMLSKAFGAKPDFSDKYDSWSDALGNEPKLILEHQLSAPKIFKEHLSKNLDKTHFVDYVLDMGKDKDGNFRRGLEGATHVDAHIECKDTNFSVLIEAKVLSDISYQVSYDMARNQIARNLDVMLDKEKDNTLFMLITPKYFKERPKTRFYGYKMNDYMKDFKNIKEDLPHRKNSLTGDEWKNMSKRLAWITWDDLANNRKQYNKL